MNLVALPKSKTKTKRGMYADNNNFQEQVHWLNLEHPGPPSFMLF